MNRRELKGAMLAGRALVALDRRYPWTAGRAVVVTGQCDGGEWECTAIDGGRYHYRSRDLSDSLDAATEARRIADIKAHERKRAQGFADDQLAIGAAADRGIQIRECSRGLLIDADDLLSLLGVESVPVERPPVREDIPDALQAIVRAALDIAYGEEQ